VLQWHASKEESKTNKTDTGRVREAQRREGRRKKEE
jgi:hypothetical protein